MRVLWAVFGMGGKEVKVIINFSKLPVDRIEVDLHPTSVPKWKWGEYGGTGVNKDYFILLEDTEDLEVRE